MNTLVGRPRFTTSILGLVVRATIVPLLLVLFQPASTLFCDFPLRAAQNHGHPHPGSLLFAQEKRVTADTVMTYIYNAPESPLDKRYEYQWTI
jgi:hypothetical protein